MAATLDARASGPQLNFAQTIYEILRVCKTKNFTRHDGASGFSVSLSLSETPFSTAILTATAGAGLVPALVPLTIPRVPKGHRIPAQGNALGTLPDIPPRSEGTPHLPE